MPGKRSGALDASAEAAASPVRPVTPHQLLAIADPALPLQTLAETATFNHETLGRPIRIWRDDPSLAKRINDALARECQRLN